MNNSSKISFVLDNKLTEIDFADSKYTPTTTLLQYLRDLPEHRSVKEGCAEGDCGACTVVLCELLKEKLEYKAYDSCLIFLPAIHGKQVITSENLGNAENLHTVQQALYDFDGSQCGFCTPGFVMSTFALYKQDKEPNKSEISDALTGNLCRCTGYRPILDAAEHACSQKEDDHFCECEDNVVKMLKSINKSETIFINTGQQQYFIPFSKFEALKIRLENPDAVIVTGSTDVALRVTKKFEFIPKILDLSQVEEFCDFCEDEHSFTIGSNLSLEKIRLNIKSKLDALYEILSVFDSRQIRNRASLGGNLGSASPIGDSIPVLMAYDAELTLESLDNSRQIKLREFITGYRQTQCAANELITEIKIPKPDDGTIIKSYKNSERKDLDISTVSACFRLKLNGNIVEEFEAFFGGMAAFTKPATKTAAALKGKEWSRQNIEEAMKKMPEDFQPISDARSGEHARNIMAANLLLKFWSEFGSV
ncbi:MAG: xanthine dehydrogenase small subunit [Bacteroidales bacterium]|nr:xanthine dehydrogenase small subunit [Bacteroidales bacterium]